MERNVTPPISGPPLVRPVGGVATIAAGFYTEIVEIVAPSEAAAGDLVTVEARGKNTWTDPLYIAVTGHYNGVDFAFSPEYVEVAAGATYSFTSSFYMPNNDISVDVWSWYWDGVEWHGDDYGFVDIALKAAAPPVGCLPVILMGLAILAAIAAVAVVW